MSRTIFFLGILSILGIACKKQTSDINPNGTLIDSRDGEVYSTIRIGDQNWMAENLRYEYAGSIYKSSNPDSIYGRLYDWWAAMDACPDSWHLPSDEEWEDLNNSIGESYSEVGTAMKSIAGWSHSGGGTNASGFNAYPAGNNYSGANGFLGNIALFWSSSVDSSQYANAMMLSYNMTFFDIDGGGNRTDKLSCRCVED